MIKEKVILTSLPVTQVGQIIHFDVKIPHDALRVIGIELSGANTNPPVYPPSGRGLKMRLAEGRSFMSIIFNENPYIGEVRIQSCEKTNIFYAGDLFLTDVNAGYGDYSIRLGFPALEYTHGQKRTEYVVNTGGKTTILKGIYRDRQNPGSNLIGKGGPTGQLYTYTVNVYVWYEVDVTKLKTS
jgi:hypothetical protein